MSWLQASLDYNLYDKCTHFHKKWAERRALLLHWMPYTFNSDKKLQRKHTPDNWLLSLSRVSLISSQESDPAGNLFRSKEFAEKFLLRRTVDGHRMWRKVRNRLERDGHVRSLKVKDESNLSEKPKSALQLIKEFDVRKKDKADFQGSGDEEEEEDDEDIAVAPQFAEKGFNWHAIRLVIQSGEFLRILLLCSKGWKRLCCKT